MIICSLAQCQYMSIPSELLGIFISQDGPEDLGAVLGLSLRELRDLGCSVAEMREVKAEGVPNSTLRPIMGKPWGRQK